MSAADGAEALDTLQENQIDLVLLDIMMPKMDGFEFCEEVRQTSDVPIIILTALNRPSTFSLTATEGVTLDDETGYVILHDREVQLTPMEYKFLR